MTPEAWAVVGTLSGAFVGAFGGWIGAYIQSRAELRRERLRLALESGIREWEISVNAALKIPGNHQIAPPVTFIHYNARLLELLDKGKLTPREVLRLKREQDALHVVLDATKGTAS